MSGRRTWWHLEAARRRPDPYDVVSGHLLAAPALPDEVHTPREAWAARHREAGPLAGVDWEAWADPARLTYASWVTRARDRELALQHLLDEAEDSERAAALSPAARQLFATLYAPLRFPCHGLHMAVAYVGSLAPASRIVCATAFQAGDEVRRVHALARRQHQLRAAWPGLGADAREAWQSGPAWQPLRALVESLLVTWGWGEALVALTRCVKPALDTLFLQTLRPRLEAAGDPTTSLILASLAQDARWHHAWSRSLVAHACTSDPGRAAAVAAWRETWGARTTHALAPLHQLAQEISP